MTESQDWLLRVALRRALPRLLHRREVVERALRGALERPAELGPELAARHPELEALVRVAASDRAELALAVEETGTADQLASLGGLLEVYDTSPALGDSMRGVFDVALNAPPPVLLVLVADPLVDEAGEVIRPGGMPRRRLPWERLEAELERAIRESGRRVVLELLPATWHRAATALPRARWVVLLCHGREEDGALAFEDDRETGQRRLVPPHELRDLLGEARPDLAVVLACHGERAARALREAGCRASLGAGADQVLVWDDAIALARTLLGALLVGTSLDAARRQARTQSGFPHPVVPFGSLGPLRLPAGEPVLLSRQHWVDTPPLERWVGRERELHDLLMAVRRPCLACVHGGPGIGKTELSRVLMHRARLSRALPGGSVFVALEDVTDGDSLLLRITPVLPEAPRDLEHAGQLLFATERLVVLDNVEDLQQARGGRARLKELLKHQRGGRARVVVTSRKKLPRSRPSIPLNLLGADEAGILWLDVCRDRSAEGLEILGTLGGHPLALTIAGGLIAGGEPASWVLEDLREGGLKEAPDADGRLENLEVSVARSARQLPPGPAGFWRVIADLPCGIPEGTELTPSDRRDLQVLLDRSLVRERQGAWECVPFLQLWARHHLEPRPDRSRSLEGPVAEALREHLLALAEAHGTPAWPVAAAELARWLPALIELATEGRQELRLAGARVLYLAHFDELAYRWVERSEGGEAQLHAGRIASFLQRLEDARGHYDRALAAFAAIGDRLGEAYALRGLAMLALRSDPAEAAVLAQRSAGVALAIGDKLGAGGTIMFLGDALAAQSRPVPALNAYLLSRALCREVVSPYNEALTLRRLPAAFQAAGADEDTVQNVVMRAILASWRVGLSMSEEHRAVARQLEQSPEVEDFIASIDTWLDGLTDQLRGGEE